MDEQQGTEGTTGAVAVAMEQPAHEIIIIVAEPRKCDACGATSGNGAGPIDEGEVVFNEKTRRYERRLRCKACAPKSKRPLLALEALDAMVDRLNAERDERIAATEAARAENAQKLETASAVWRDLANGRVKVRFEVGMDGEGNLLCGMVDCPYCAGKGEVKMFVVVRTAKGWEAVGLCVHQGAARRESKVPWGRIPWGNRETCEQEAKKRQDALIYFIDLWAGKAARPELITDERGHILCGVPGCGEKHPAGYGLVSEKRLDKVGLCLSHAIAGRDANRQGTNFFIDSLADCGRHLRALEHTIEQFAHRLEKGAPWTSRRDERPAKKPEKPAAEKKAAVPVITVPDSNIVEAVGRGPVSIEEAAAAGDPVAADVLRHNHLSAATCDAKRKNKGGGKKDGKSGKGGRKHDDRD